MSENRWTIIGEADRDSGGRARLLCRCECGTVKEIDSYSVRSGKSRSCGCLNSELTAQRNFRHGKRHTREYDIWAGMNQRCNDPGVECFRHYGGRGIKVCERWVSPHGFAAFLEDMGTAPTPSHQIDRKDNDGNYEPGNCHWVTQAENARNKSNARLLTFRGETKSITEWSRITLIPRLAITLRLDRRGWSVEKALSTPVWATRNNI
jgi:hypothetical protein